MTPSVLDIVCTAKGTHKRTRITKVAVNEDGSGSWQVTPAFAQPDDLNPDLPPARADGQPNNVFVALCPRCGRALELRPDTFRVLVGKLMSLGVSQLDVSDLPF